MFSAKRLIKKLAARPKLPPRGDFESSDLSGNIVKHPDEVAKWNHDSADMFEMGTVYTIVAGLLNLLVICDAFGGPLVIHPP